MDDELRAWIEEQIAYYESYLETVPISALSVRGNYRGRIHALRRVLHAAKLLQATKERE